MAVDIPVDFVDGQELEADDLNKIIATRTGDIKPIDDTTREYTDEAGSLGASDKRYLKAYIGDLTLENNTITSSDGVVNAFGAKPADETGATLVVNLSSYSTTYYSATTGWYTLELKGAGGNNSFSAGDGQAGGYLKTTFYVPYDMTLVCIGSNTGTGGSGQGGGSSVMYSELHEFIAGGGGGNDYNGGWDCRGENGGSGGRWGGTYVLGWGTVNKETAGRNNLNNTSGGGSAVDNNGTVKLWKH